AQNHSFRDHYLDLAFDLSKVLFITTANTLATIQPALRDRMEIIELPGYTEEEKLGIAQRYLVPRQLAENGLKPGQLTIEPAAISLIISRYTREAGVRNVEREIGTICRKVATKFASHTPPGPVIVRAEQVEDYLGPIKFPPETARRTRVPGVATGVAVTAAGGDVLFIEAISMPGAKGFMYTGQLGEVMSESARAAYSYVRSRIKDLGASQDFFEKSDIHLHIPAGAIPKDGPSAGVTMATALASLATGRPVRNDVAMTGEITLTGLVLPVGGIKEKALAARRAGVKTFILPKQNESDLREIPPELRRDLHFAPVETVDQAWALALEPAKA
ncbi:MAG: endopeptidase La, partial [Deinococcus sp.]|nr:endopeptidase La [Deinococcus sp.]